MRERPISGARVARELLGRSPAWFTQHRPELEKAGFPRPLPVLNTYMPSVVLAAIKAMGLKWTAAEGIGYEIDLAPPPRDPGVGALPSDLLPAGRAFAAWDGIPGVYFVGFSSFIKIGVSRSIGQRLREIGSHIPEPLILHGAIVGAGGLEEFAMHRRFKAHRRNGEWFDAAPDILEFIEVNRRP